MFIERSEVACIVSKPVIAHLWGVRKSFKIKHPEGSGFVHCSGFFTFVTSPLNMPSQGRFLEICFSKVPRLSRLL